MRYAVVYQPRLSPLHPLQMWSWQHLKKYSQPLCSIYGIPRLMAEMLAVCACLAWGSLANAKKTADSMALLQVLPLCAVIPFSVAGGEA